MQAPLTVLVVITTVALLLIALQPADAANGRWTRGDAEMMLDNYPPGNGLFARLGPELETRASLDMWALQWGRILAPGELSVGRHTLNVIVQSDVWGVIFNSSVNFTVSPTESFACAD